MRNHYECPVNIRGTKLQAAEGAFEELLAITEMSREGEKVAIIGGGPAGLAAAYHAQKHGLQATVFEKRETLGGIVRNVIPGFRIGDDAIDNDIALIKKTGAEFVMGKEAPDAQELKAMGNDTEVFLYEGIAHPVKCDKIRYYKDRYFTSRLLPKVDVPLIRL